MRLNHINLKVRDLRRAAQFYARHFGFTNTVHDDDDFAMVGSDEGSLIAFEVGDPLPHAGEIFRCGFGMSSKDEVRRVQERLEQSGLDVAIEQDDGRMLIIRVIDPDGYIVEVFAW